MRGIVPSFVLWSGRDFGAPDRMKLDTPMSLFLLDNLLLDRSLFRLT
jgi:hypothetical protein